ncbi:MAG: hypothetical protein WCJ01_01475 [Ignavibacteria bacterium]
MQDKSDQSEYENWSIEKGDYARSDPSEQDQKILHPQKISIPVKVVLITLSVIAVVLGYILYVKHFSY